MAYLDLVLSSRDTCVSKVSDSDIAKQGLLIMDGYAAEKDCQSSFLRMPAELRNEVYGYVYSNSDDICNRMRDTTNQLALLSTCKQIHREATLLAFSNTLFRLRWASKRSFNLHAQALSIMQVQAIRQICIATTVERLFAMKSWAGLPFGRADLHLDQLTIMPQGEPCYVQFPDRGREIRPLADVMLSLIGLRQVKTVFLVNDGYFDFHDFRVICRITVFRLQQQHWTQDPRTWWRCRAFSYRPLGSQRLELELVEGKIPDNPDHDLAGLASLWSMRPGFFEMCGRIERRFRKTVYD